MILCATLNPCVDKTIYVDSLKRDVIQTASRVTITVGGKANNVARVLSAFGHEAVALNFLGGETGRLCERILKEEDRVTTETVWTRNPTREIITIYEAELNRHTDIKEPSALIYPAERDEYIERFAALLPRARWVSYGGSAPCPCVDDVPAVLARMARVAGVPFILDTYGTALAVAIDERPFMIKPNIAEAQMLFGERIEGLDGAVNALERLSSKAELVVLSLGEDGFLTSYKGRRYRVHSPQVLTRDAVGSGDALVAAVIAGISEKMAFSETLALAAAAGAANAASVMACRISRADVEALMAKASVEVL